MVEPRLHDYRCFFSGLGKERVRLVPLVYLVSQVIDMLLYKECYGTLVARKWHSASGWPRFSTKRTREKCGEREGVSPKALRHFLSGMCLYNLLEGKQCCVMWYLEDGAQGLVVNADCVVP